MDSLLNDLDNTKLQTGILYDRVSPFAHLEGFNERGDTSSFEHFRQAWSELYRSSYQKTFANVDVLKQNYEFHGIYDHIDLGIIHASFDKLDKEENQDKWQITNGRLKSKVNKDPFVTEDLFLVSPLANSAWGQSITFHFKEEHFLKQSKNTLEKLEIDFGTGSWKTILLEGRIVSKQLNVVYDTPGEKIIRSKAILTDGRKVQTQSTLNVAFAPQTLAMTGGAIQNRSVKASIAFKGYDESTSIKGKAEYRIFFHTNGGNTSPTLLKPIIIIDGFDPKDKRKIESTDPGHNPDNDPNFKSIFDLMSYSGNNLVSTLQQEGYDVVIINHNPYTADENGQQIVGGGDYVERNAMVLIKVIQDLNAELQTNSSSEDLVIIGPSMGGLISRYALAYMEKNSLTHNTRLWVSFDSPHLGANIPISIHQTLYFFGVIGGDAGAQETLNKELGSVAARQMLIDQRNNMNNTAPFRQQFIANLSGNGIAGSGGFPINLRKISLINGTTKGIKNHTEGQRYLDVEGYYYTLKVAYVKTNFLGNSNQSLQTFQGKTFISILDPSYSQTVTTYNPNQNGSMDVTPGSTFNTGEIMYEKFDKAFKDAGLFVSWSAYQPNHSFIPSVSALAFESSNFLWKNPINRNLICTNEIPFDSYFAPAVNESHIQLTNDNVDWVLQEINGIPQQPTVRPMAIDLVGPETSCGTATYTFTSCSTVGSASWSVSPNLQIVSSTGNSISVKSKYSSYSGSQTITATFSNGISMNKSIVLGPPNYQNIELSVDNNELSNCDYTYADADYDHPPGPSPAILEYEWRIPYSYDWDIYEEYGGFADFQYVEIEYWDSNPPNQEAIQIRARNTCGWSWWKEFWVDVDDCGGYFMMMSPNPSSDFLNISFQRAELESLNAKEVTTTRIPEKNIISEIYDQHQNLVLMQDGEMNTGLTIDTSQLQPGRYIIKVYVDDQIFTRHLLIE